MKSKFLLNEFFTLSITGALQRANVYAKNASSEDKEGFKKDLRNYLNTVIEPYFNPVSEADHLKHIQGLSEFSSRYASSLKNGSLSFGVSQLVLNLFLKYIWCLKLIPDPPHFPVDTKIQERLNQYATSQHTEEKPIVAWTKISRAADYSEIIHHAQHLQRIAGKTENSLAEFELSLSFNT